MYVKSNTILLHKTIFKIDKALKDNKKYIYKIPKIRKIQRLKRKEKNEIHNFKIVNFFITFLIVCHIMLIGVPLLVFFSLN